MSQRSNIGIEQLRAFCIHCSSLVSKRLCTVQVVIASICLLGYPYIVVLHPNQLILFMQANQFKIMHRYVHLNCSDDIPNLYSITLMPWDRSVSRPFYSLDKTVTTPPPFTATRLCAESPHPTFIESTATFSGSDQSFVAFEYCFTVIPDRPPITRNCAV